MTYDKELDDIIVRNDMTALLKLLATAKEERDCALARFSGDNETKMDLGVWEVDYVNDLIKERDDARAALKLERGHTIQMDKEAAAERARSAKLVEALEELVEALEEVDYHLNFFNHVEKRYKEAGKDKVAFDKCAEIRAAHEVVQMALAEYKTKGRVI